MFGASFDDVTAFRLSWSVPTLFLGTTASYAARPSGVEPKTDTSRAVIDNVSGRRLVMG